MPPWPALPVMSNMMSIHIRQAFLSPLAASVTRANRRTTIAASMARPPKAVIAPRRIAAFVTAPPMSCSIPSPPEFREKVPDTCGMCHNDVGRSVPHQRSRPSAGQRHFSGPHLHRLPWRTLHPGSIQQASLRVRLKYPRHLRELPRQRAVVAAFRPSHRPRRQLRRLFPRLGREGRQRDRRQLRQLPWRSQYSAIIRSSLYHQRQKPGHYLR